MKLQPLIGKRKIDIKDIVRWHAKHILEGRPAKGYFLFEDIKSACEFYDRYKNYPELLIKEQKELLTKVDKLEEAREFMELIQQFDETNSLRQQIQYNNWLFKFTFKDVLQEG